MRQSSYTLPPHNPVLGEYQLDGEWQRDGEPLVFRSAQGRVRVRFSAA